MEVKVTIKIRRRHSDGQKEENTSHSGREEQKGNRDMGVGGIWCKCNGTGT